MSKPREWNVFVVGEEHRGFLQADELPGAPFIRYPIGREKVHVIEAAPVLKEIAALKKQLAETKKQLDDLIAAELGG